MSFWDNVKKFAQPYADEDEYDDYDEMDGYEDEMEEPAPEPAPRGGRRARPARRRGLLVARGEPDSGGTDGARSDRAPRPGRGAVRRRVAAPPHRGPP